MHAAFLILLMPFFLWHLFVPAELFSSLLSLVGLDESHCSVHPQDLYVEVGSSVTVTCHFGCLHGKIIWKLNHKVLNESLSETINSSCTVISLPRITEPSSVLVCYNSDKEQFLGGTVIKTYSEKFFCYLLAALDGYNHLFYVAIAAKPAKLSCKLCQTKEYLPELLTCSWEHHHDSNLQIYYTIMW